MHVPPKLYILFALVSLLSACGHSTRALLDPRFSIIKSGDTLTDEKVPYGYIGINNLLPRKSPYGLMHYGLYLDPFVFKEKNTNKIESLGFFLGYCHYKDYYGFNPMKSITFLTDTADRIEASVKPIDRIESSRNPTTNGYDIKKWHTNYQCPYSEAGSIELQLDDFTKLALAKWIQVKVHGTQGSHTYNRDDVRPSVTSNINIFYKYILKK